MSRHSVTARDLRAMFDVLDEARHDDGEDFPPRSLLRGLGRLIPCDIAGFDELDIPTRRYLYLEEALYGGDYEEPDVDAYWRWRHQVPYCRLAEQSCGRLPVAQHLDFFSAREFRNLPFYTEYLRPAVNILFVMLPSAPGRIRTYNFGREDARRFTERDRLVLELLRPHLYAVYREAALRRRAPVRLTVRELDVMRAVADGLSTEAIARQFTVAPSTVRKHLENVFRKLGVSSRTAALARLFPEPDPGA
ncbi:helix-turn-helix transcriptional regulator [Streptomyces sp. S.PB5]|uniref:helix-turn-helix transcriptional regulator n=1 Tax=Streptomyces sp. S.PB5 TaxID=3020844 RepID=UPI0025B19041|nr:helix-turn-helix transcriptional regulator [Streptomyces sp. S.PB5]MDN3021986.1 helix-turn-helix transcriptional regulator [Streptomyces sp. S.PB5]